MTATTSATVETLTAEVRTLVVGTRQITLSVANQLDIVPLNELTVMGRVSLHRKDRVHNHFVIGPDGNGVLSLAEYDPYYSAQTPHIFAEDVPGKVTVCKAQKLSYPSADHYSLRIGGKVFHLSQGAAITCEEEGHGVYRAQCSGWTATTEQQDWICEAIYRWQNIETEKVAEHQAAVNAPLIVLAGLR